MQDIRRDGAYQPMTISENDKQLLKLVREMAGNDQCADCQATGELLLMLFYW